jgi:putative membrane protein insertion efficiency factor
MGSWANRVGVLAGVALIRTYQLLLAPFAGGACRFEPSCSEYARQAVETHGLMRGLLLAVRRVGRCHPFARAGFDPVPPRPETLASQPSATSLRRP